MSILELARITPVSPPTVNKKTNPMAHIRDGLIFIQAPWIVVTQLKILIPVGTAIIIVAVVK